MRAFFAPPEPTVKNELSIRSSSPIKAKLKKDKRLKASSPLHQELSANSNQVATAPGDDLTKVLLENADLQVAVFALQDKLASLTKRIEELAAANAELAAREAARPNELMPKLQQVSQPTVLSVSWMKVGPKCKVTKPTPENASLKSVHTSEPKKIVEPSFSDPPQNAKSANESRARPIVSRESCEAKLLPF